MAETIGAALVAAGARLAAVSDTPRLDAELLMAHALGITRETLLLARLDALVPPGFADLLAQRLAHQPLAYLTGSRDFWTLTLHVAPGVLIPRPDSETLIEAAIDHFGARAPTSILDLGTGSGALLLAALAHWPDARGLGIDASLPACAIAQANADRLGFGDRATIRHGDWAQGLSERFDLILCNPPYVESDAPLAPELAAEPASALFAGADGLDDYRVLIPQLRARIAGGGVALLEIGDRQAEAVSRLCRAHALEVSLRHDLAGRDRCLVLTPVLGQ